MHARRTRNHRQLAVQVLETRRLLAADAGVIPVDAHAFGTTYGELAGEWWNWVGIEPSASNPLLDETGEFADANQSGKIWFLAGTFGNDETNPITERSTTIPTGKAIFFPVLNNVFLATDPNDTEESLREGANAAADDPQSLSVTVDGREIDALKYRAESPAGGFTLSVPENSLFTEFGLPAGEYAPAVADGYWILLAPLNRGTHEISFSGVDNLGFTVNVRYEIEVLGGQGALVAVPLPAALKSSAASDEETDLAVLELALKDVTDEKTAAATSDVSSNEPVAIIKPSIGGDKAAAKRAKEEVDLALLDLMQLGT